MDSNPAERRCVIVGRGRAGLSFEGALRSIGWSVTVVPSRPLLDDRHALDAVMQQAVSAELVLLAVPDGAISDVARRLGHVEGVVAHVSGACSLDVLAPHARTGSIHPLMSLPNPATGVRRLLDACNFAVDGDEMMTSVAHGLGGRAFSVGHEHRALYHATASVAANHVTVLCAQVERLADLVPVPVDAFWTLMTTTIENIVEGGARESLTGPASRGDWTTVRAHLAALPHAERALYLVLAAGAADLGGQEMPDDLRHAALEIDLEQE